MRSYLTTLREDSYVQIKPGYTDTAAVKAEPIEEVAAAPEKDDSKNKSGRKFGILPKKKSGTRNSSLYPASRTARPLPLTFLFA
jgi:hypothetical protein